MLTSRAFGLSDGVEDKRAYPLEGESAAAFTRRMRPSSISKEEVEWIQVFCPAYVPGVKRVVESKQGAATAEISKIIDTYRRTHVEASRQQGRKISEESKVEHAATLRK